MFERIDVNKTNGSPESIYCDFLEINFVFYQKVFTGFHDLMQKAVIFNVIEILMI